MIGIDRVDELRGLKEEESTHANGHDGNENSHPDGKRGILEQLIRGAEAGDGSDDDSEAEPEDDNPDRHDQA